MSLTLNNIVIESRESDHFINATQLCKAGGKKFNDWFKLDSTNALISELKLDLSPLKTKNVAFKNLVETKKGRYNSGSWIHPDLAVQLAQWISPMFAIQVSRWVRELMTTGSVSIDSRKSDEELKELQNRVAQLEEESKEKDNQLNRLHNQVISYKKRNSKDETIYIVSTADYARQGIFKIGRTKSQMKTRNTGHNTVRVKGDKVKVIAEFKVNDSALIEKYIHTKLSGLLVEGERELFICPFNILHSLVDLIIHNDDEENEQINRVIETVYNLRRKQFSADDWMDGIPEDIFKEQLTIMDGDEKVLEMDVSRWPESRKKEFIAFCFKEYIKMNNGGNEEDFQIAWKTFMSFMIGQLSVPRSQFRIMDWKPLVKTEAKKEKLAIKWRGE